MGILDDYFNSSADTSPVASTPSGSVLNQYFDEALSEKGKAKAITIRPVAPPISGATPEQSDVINAQPAQQGGANPREGILSLPAKAGEAIYGAAKSGVEEAGQGIGDILSNKPATGIGKIGTGALSVLTSPVAGIEQLAGDVTGSPDIASRAGFVAGAALPVVPGVSAINKISPKNKALSELVEKITSNGREPEKLVETVQAMKANPRIGPADVSPAVLNMAQKLFTTEGDVAKNYLHAASTNRVKSSAAAVNAAYDEATGLPVNAVNKLRELSEAAKKVGSEKINPAITGAGPVNTNSVVEHIDNILKPGVMQKITGDTTLPFPKVKQALANVKAMFANDKERLTDPQSLHDFQAALRREAEARLKSSDGEQRQLGSAIMTVRNKIVDAINEASPKIKDANGKEIGSYKPALSEYRDEKDIANAFHDAYNGILTNSKKLENRPEFTAEWFKGLTEHEKQAAIEGLRTRIDTEIGVAKNPALAGTSLGKSDFNQKKIEAIIGKEETKKLLDTLEAERAISNTHNKIIEGSQTEMRHAGDKAIALPVKGESKGLAKYVIPAVTTGAEIGGTMAGLPTGIGGALGLGASAIGAGVAKGGSAASFAIRTALAKERNAQLAKYALPTEGPSRDELIRQLEARIPGPKQSLLTRGASKLSRIVAP